MLEAKRSELLAQARDVATDWASALDRSRSSEAELPYRSIAAEIATAWRVSDRTIQQRMETAHTLKERFPLILRAWKLGRITAAHVRVIVDAGAHIDSGEMRGAYEESVIDYAERESASRLAPIARRRAQWHCEQTIAERHRAARRTRGVTTRSLEDGMAELNAVLPAPLAAGIYDRLSTMAREVTRAEAALPAPDRRTIDQVRADVLSDMLLGSEPTAHPCTPGIRATVSVTVPVLALLSDSASDPLDDPQLAGYGPIDPETARHLAADVPGVERIMTHPITGAVLAVDRYRPSEDLRRHLRSRDLHCRFPGCRMSLDRCDIDHTRDAQFDGPTDSANLAHLCRRHHTLKHHTPWQVTQSGAGELTWRSPTGKVYTDRPTSTVTFSLDPECDPPPPPNPISYPAGAFAFARSSADPPRQNDAPF